MADFTIAWKKITRGLPRAKSYSDDRIPTIEEIRRLLEYPDRRIKAIVYTMASSGIRLGAWDYLKCGHIRPIQNEGEIVAAAKMIVYAEEEDEYFSFISKEAYRALADWMKYREFPGELIDENSWVMRDLGDTQVAQGRGFVTKPNKLTSIGLKKLINRGIWAQGLGNNQAPFNFDIVFGFTDSIFVKGKDKENAAIEQFILQCKEYLGITVEIKNVFQNSIVNGKKNRFVGYTRRKNEEPIIKGLDGLAGSNPLWVRKWFFKMVNEIIKKTEERFRIIPKRLKEAVLELENVICESSSSIEKELKYTQRLIKCPQNMPKVLELVCWEGYWKKIKVKEVYWFETNCNDKNTGSNFSITVPTSKNLNLKQYKRLLLDKLKDTLGISNFDITGITLELLKKTLPINFYG